MKHSVLIVILLILLSFGFYLGANREGPDGQAATIIFDETNANKGEVYETPKNTCVVFGAELSAQRLFGPAGGTDGPTE